MDWFRSHHGAPSDPKWLVVARKAKVAPALVVSTFWMLLDYASQHQDRGSIQGFDVEVAAAFLGIEDAEVEAILRALGERGVIVDNRLSNWDKRQPKREDDSRERVRNHRNAKRESETQEAPKEAPVTQPVDDVTQCNASVTQCNDREIDREIERSSSPTPSQPEMLPTATKEKAFSLQDPLPLHVQNFLTESCPDFYEDHLRLALVGRSPSGLGSYAIEILRGWKRGKNAPSGPLPEVAKNAAPPEPPLRRFKSPGPEQALVELAALEDRMKTQEAKRVL